MHEVALEAGPLRVPLFHDDSPLRAIARRPGLAVARLLTVAVVVSAIASVTAIASATLFRRLPFPDPDRLVQIYDLSSDTTDLANATPLFPVVFNHLDARGASIEAVAGIWQLDRALAGRGEPESVSAGRVSANFFSVLGASLAAGRTFTEDEVKNDAALVVLSHGLWTRMFGSDPAIIGTVIQIDRRPHTVIGVTTRDFDPAFTATQFWTPLLVRDADVGARHGRANDRAPSRRRHGGGGDVRIAAGARPGA